MEPFSLISIIASASLILLTIIIWVKSHKIRVDITYIILSLIFFAAGNALTLFGDLTLFVIGQVVLSGGFFFVFVHYDGISSQRPKLRHIAVLATLQAGIVMETIFLFAYVARANVNLATLTFIANDPSATADMTVYLILLFNSLLSSGLCLFSIGRAIVVMGSVFRFTKAPAARNEIIALILIFVYRVVFESRLFMPPTQYQTPITLALLLAIVGVIILILNYLLHPDYLYLIPVPIHSFMIYNNTGLLSYSRSVQTDTKRGDTQFILISGALTAIFSLIKETLGQGARIKFIDAQQFRIFFNPLPRDQGTFVVIAYGATVFFSKSLDRFVQSIPISLMEQINHTNVDLEAVKPEFDLLVKTLFPYVTFNVEKL